MVIIGIDPGTANTGYGIVRKTKKQLKCLDYGVIKTSPVDSPGERLRIINNQISKLIKKHQAKVLAVERLYYFRNQKTIAPVSQAKGVVLLAAARKKIPVFELTPLEVKMSITGFGRADKKDVQKAIKKILNLDKIPKPDDAADALAIAISYLNLSQKKKKGLS